MYKEIVSKQNQLIKHISQLQEKSRFRKKHKQFVVEGLREIQLAIHGGYQVAFLLFCDTIFDTSNVETLSIEASKIIKISKDIYHKLAFRESTEGVIAIFHSKSLSLSELKFKNNNPLILVAEAPEKPGNIGALLRTADAADLDAVIIANAKTDVYNPNIIRSSVGCVFTNQIANGTTAEVISFLKEHSISIYCAVLTASKEYHKVAYANSAAIVVGTEATGLSEAWLNASDQNIIIPMLGAIDSLNVSVSAGILIYEVKRQRNFE